MAFAYIFRFLEPLRIPYLLQNTMFTCRARMALQLALQILIPEVPGSSPVAGNIYYFYRDSLYLSLSKNQQFLDHF